MIYDAGRENQKYGFPTRSDTNQAVQPQFVSVSPLVWYCQFDVGNAICTKVTNIWQQIMQTKYSMGKSSNAGKVTSFIMASLIIFYDFLK